MMKKQMLFTGLVLGFIASNGIAQAKNDGDAFKLHIFESNCRWDNEKGIPSTDEINGKHIWNLLHSDGKIDPTGISVIEQLKNGKFADSKKLDKFSQKTLDWCNFHFMLHGEEFARDKYDADSVSLIKSLREETCYLCIDGDQQAIVTHAQGRPEEVCEVLRPGFEKNRKEKQRLVTFDKKYKENISRSWKKAEQDKATRK